MRRFARSSPRSIAFARTTSSCAVSSLCRPTSARKSCRLSAAPPISGTSRLTFASEAFSLSRAATGGPTSSPIVSSSRVSCSISSSFRSCSTVNASKSASSMKPRSSAPSTRVRALSVSSSSLSWFCVKLLGSVLSRFFLASLRRKNLRSVRAISWLSRAGPHGVERQIRSGIPSFAGRRLRRTFPVWPLLSSRRPSQKKVCGLLRALAGGLSAFLPLNRAFRPALGEQFDRPFECHLSGVVTPPETRIRLAVGDVRAEASAADDDRLARDGVGADLAQRPGRAAAPPAALLRLREQRERLLERDRQELLLRLE